MILYITTEKNVNLIDFLNDYGAKKDFIIQKKIGKYAFKHFVTNNNNDYSHIKEIILDRTAILEKDGELVSLVEQFSAIHNVRFTVIYMDLSENDDFFKEMLAIGVNNLVISTSLTQIRQDILHCVSENGLQKYQEKPCDSSSVERYNFDCQNIKIGVLGSQNRIGATTFAISLTHWLSSVSAKVNYIEATDKNKLNLLALEYGIKAQQDEFIAEDILFTRGAPQVGCNFEVYDIGYPFEYKMNRVGQMDILVLAFGGKTSELPYTKIAFQTLENKKSYILPVFVTDDRLARIKNIFTNENHKILKSQYVPDYINSNSENYKKIIHKYIATE